MATFLKLLRILLYGLLVLVMLAISLGWLFYAAIGWGRWLACAGLALTCLLVTLYLRFAQHRTRPLWGWISGGLGLFIVAILVGMLFATPSGNTNPNSPVSQHFMTNTRFPRYAISNIVPEAEQINLGFVVIPYLDSIFTHEQASRVRGFTLDLYREMERDPDFHALGSSMGWAYADLFGRPYDAGHYYLYVPRNRPSGSMPVIIFLHGSMGNFKAYTWVWSSLAEELGYVIIAPSFGFGNWREPGGVDAAVKALEDAQTIVELDENRLYLAGLSNGGLGVSLLAASMPQRFRGLMFISPVMAIEVIDQVAFQSAWADRPVLIVTGQADKRVPIAYVTERVRGLERGGVAVKYIVYPEEDHFLFFSQPTRVLEAISQWLRTED
ncbi:MAG: alpha/beta fold hydrolase [Anaerolineae bacterium]|nr:alpha/beta fold hydrolase [Anaerolineae bacterium]